MHTHEMVLSALLCQEFNERAGARVTLLEGVDEEGWKLEWSGEEGLQFCDAKKYVESVTHRVLDRSGSNVFRNIECELLKVDVAIKPHYHKHTDSVVIVLDPVPKSCAWDAVIEKPLPYPGGYELWNLPLGPGNMFVLPRMVVHGFLPRSSEWSPLYLLSLSCPGYDPKDTHYV